MCRSRGSRLSAAIGVAAAALVSVGCGGAEPSASQTSTPAVEVTDASVATTPPDATTTTGSAVAATATTGSTIAETTSTTEIIIAETSTTVAESSEPLLPSGDFYTPPNPMGSAEPGTLIWAERIELELNPPATVWRILYHSRSEQDEDIAVSGFVVVPEAAPPADGRDVFAWAHGTVGMGDQCAPSRAVRDNLPPFGGMQVERGSVLVATDYAGLGTPGVPTYAEGDAEARAVLDSVRASRELPGVGAIDDVVVAGHSQGGAAALLASEIVGTYAPELTLVGSVALAPGAVLPSFVDGLLATTQKGLVLIGASGLRAGHPEIDLGASLTPAALADLTQVEAECVDETVARYEDVPLESIVSQLPSEVNEIADLLQDNAPGSQPIAVPVLIAQGLNDLPVQVEVSAHLVDLYCTLGADVSVRMYPNADHMGVFDVAAPDVLAFITASYQHGAPLNDCP